jgi:PKD repeat protein
MKKILITILSSFLILSTVTASALAQEPEENINPETVNKYLQAVINVDEGLEVGKNSIFDASQSFVPEKTESVFYEWDFGDGNKNEGVEVFHTYKTPGKYTINLKISAENNESETSFDIFAYRKLIILLTDQTQVEERIELIKNYAEQEGVFIKIIDSFGSATEFISEEILSKKLTEQSSSIQKSSQIVSWTKENAGLNALSRYLKNNNVNIEQKFILDIEESPETNKSRIQRQFGVLNPKEIIIAKEASIYPLIKSENEESFISTLEVGGYEYIRLDKKTGKLRPWNFMSYFVNSLINQGIPDNTIALLLLLPVIATIIAFMKQVVGITTFGIYTPSIITLSFLIIGLPAGLLTLFAAISIGALGRPILKKVRMLFIPKMAIIITLVSLSLFLILILSTYLNLFNTEFLSLAIFPMLILSTLVEKFISVKTEKGLSSAAVLMAETVFVAIIAYFIVGGEINLGIMYIKFEFIKNLMITYPEIIFLLLIINVLLGKWSGLRLLERIRFREVLRHIEE